jgi:purine-cytosine permease-like protein
MERRGQGLFPAAATAKKVGVIGMVSVWWMIAASCVGVCAGVLVMALMQASGNLPGQSTRAPDPNRLP